MRRVRWLLFAGAVCSAVAVCCLVRVVCCVLCVVCGVVGGGCWLLCVRRRWSLRIACVLCVVHWVLAVTLWLVLFVLSPGVCCVLRVSRV